MDFSWPSMGGNFGFGGSNYMSQTHCDDPEMQAKFDRLAMGDLSVLKEAEDNAKREDEERATRNKEGNADGAKPVNEEELENMVKDLNWMGDDGEDAQLSPGFPGFSWGAAEDFKDITMDNTLTLVGRDEWGATPANEGTRPMEWPIGNVVISYRSECGPCADRAECQLRMRELQAHHKADGAMPDIPYNFMIDQEGVVYEARGWGLKSAESLYADAYPEYTSHRLDVCLIGDYRTYMYPQKAVNAVFDLARDGVDKGYMNTFAEFWDYRQGCINGP